MVEERARGGLRVSQHPIAILQGMYFLLCLLITIVGTSKILGYQVFLRKEFIKKLVKSNIISLLKMGKLYFNTFRELLNEYDPDGLIGSHKWARGVREEREKVLKAIQGPFCLRCKRKDGVTTEQASQNCFIIIRDHL